MISPLTWQCFHFQRPSSFRSVFLPKNNGLQWFIDIVVRWFLFTFTYIGLNIMGTAIQFNYNTYYHRFPSPMQSCLLVFIGLLEANFIVRNSHIVALKYNIPIDISNFQWSHNKIKHYKNLEQYSKWPRMWLYGVAKHNYLVYTPTILDILHHNICFAKLIGLHFEFSVKLLKIGI